MPRGDRTGPRGLGAMTGRAAGYCAGFGVPGYANFPAGRGFGAGCGGGRAQGGGCGRGYRHMFYATGMPGWMRYGQAAAFPGQPAADRPAGPDLEPQLLKHRAEALQAELDFIKQRLSEDEAKD